MKSHVEIIISGEDFPTLSVMGASFQYGLNTVPVATAELDPQAATGLLCNFEQHRRKLVTLIARTTNGCVHFDGFIDGASVSQQSGSLGLSLVIKGRQQWLLEAYTRVPGLHPSSLAVFDNLKVLHSDFGVQDGNFVKGVQLGVYALNKVSLEQPLFQVVKAIYLEAFNLIAKSPLIFNKEIALLPTVVITQAAEVFLAAKQPLVRAMISSMDTTAVDGILLTAAAAQLGPDLINTVVQTLNGSVFDSVVQLSQQYGCNLVVGNSKMYIVPDVGFIKMPHIATVARAQHSDIPNIIYPADYLSYQFNDQGYRDIKGCYLSSRPESMTLITATGLTRCLGHYVDPQAIGGILIEHLPQFVSGPLEYLSIKNSKVIGKACAAGALRGVDGAPTQKSVEAQERIIFQNTEQAANDFVQKVGNNWAQLTYLQRKFADRDGSIDAVFNPNWAPGGVGTLYTRYPGTWLDFRVTAVTHSFRATPGAASANTSIQFDCGRMGGATNSGIDMVDYYQYDYGKSEAFANDFVANVSQ